MHTEIKRYFQLQDLPFEQTPNLRFLCDFEFYQNALEAIVASVEKGEPMVKVVGEVGTGKTLLCRKLIDVLDARDIITLYIHNPLLSTETLLRLIADELMLEHAHVDTEYYLYKAITDKVVSYYHAQKKVVLLIDEAQTLSDASLEALRLLTNLESEHRKLIQLVFFGQPELDERLLQKKFRQLRQRIAFNVYLKALQPLHISYYLRQRLIVAGHETGELFSPSASQLIYEASRGIPRVVNILAYKALLAAYAQSKMIIDKAAVQAAVMDSVETIASCQSQRKSGLSKEALIVIALIFLGLFILILLFLLIG